MCLLRRVVGVPLSACSSPPRTLIQRTHTRAGRLVTEDGNTWVGVPVGVEAHHKSQQKVFGPSLRFTTSTLPESVYGKSAHDASLGPSAIASELQGQGEPVGFYKTRYNWIPAPLVKAGVAAAQVQEAASSATATGTPERAAERA